MSTITEEMDRREVVENVSSQENSYDESSSDSIESSISFPTSTANLNDVEEAVSLPHSNSNNNNNNNNSEQATYSVDDIEVEVDFDLPVSGDCNRERRANGNIDTSNSIVRTNRSTRNARRRRRQRSQEQSIIVPSRLPKNWCLGFFSGIFTGIIFFTIGIVFVIYFNHLPNYIGVLFILVSLPPCCLSVNKLRTARQSTILRRRAERRQAALRQLHDEGREDDSYRNRDLPYSDLPPPYHNLAFTNDFEMSVSTHNTTMSTSSVDDENHLPSYQDAINLKKLKSKDKKHDEIQSSGNTE